MTKYAGMVGFATNVESTPGVWVDTINEVKMFGDVEKMGRTSGEEDEDIVLQNQIRLVANPETLNAMFSMRYVTWLGTKWKVKSVTYEKPRIVVQLGGPYFGSENTSNATQHSS